MNISDALWEKLFGLRQSVYARIWAQGRDVVLYTAFLLLLS